MNMTPDQLRELSEKWKKQVIWGEQPEAVPSFIVDLLEGYATAIEEVERLKKELDELKVAFCNLVQKASASNEMHKKAERRAERLNAAIRWALGYEDWPERKPGEGPFYWREELRRRADKGE